MLSRKCTRLEPANGPLHYPRSSTASVLQEARRKRGAMRFVHLQLQMKLEMAWTVVIFGYRAAEEKRIIYKVDLRGVFHGVRSVLEGHRKGGHVMLQKWAHQSAGYLGT